jgi:hypothetical protein
MSDSPSPIPSFGSGSGNREESGPPVVPIAIGAVAVLIVVALFALLGRNSGNDSLAPAADPYAANLSISGLVMSTAANFAGQEVTYIEGKITNSGSKTVTNALMQIVFKDVLGQVAQKEPAQRVMVITTREPYIDTTPLNNSPLRPGQTREFRQTFEHLSADWNRQLPEVSIVKTSTE